MTYVRAAAKLVLDNPNADGQIVLWGIGRDWVAAEEKATFVGISADVAGSYGWQYGGCFRYVERLKGIAPLGSAPETDMKLSDWTPIAGSWCESSTAGALKRRYLHCYDGRPNLTSAIRSNAIFRPNLTVRVWRFPPDQETTQADAFEIRFLGNGRCPEYALLLPSIGPGGSQFENLTGVADGEYRDPLLLGRPKGVTKWAIIDVGKGGTAARTSDAAPVFQVVTLEYVAGWLLIYLSDSPDVWAYTGDWTDANGIVRNFALVPGRVRITVYNHTAMFNSAQVTYPASADLVPSAWFYTGPLVNPSPSYRVIGYTPPGTALFAAPQGGAGKTRPVVTFTSSGENCAVLYNVQEYRPAVIGNAQSDPVSTEGNPDLQIVSLRGYVDDSWRGAHLEAELKAQPGRTLPELKANCRVSASVSLDGGATWTQMFTGYNVPLEKRLDAGALGRTRATLHAADWIEARGRHKPMYWHCSLEGWPVDEAFKYILGRAGVDESLIAIDPAISAATMGAYYYLPLADPRGDRILQFRPDENVVTALDRIAALRDLQWGVDENGIFFLRPRPVHAPGHYDFVIDDAAADAEDFRSFRRVRGLEDYYNVLAVLAGDGFTAAGRMVMDLASIQDPTARNYLGDDWWRFEAEPEGDSLDRIVSRLWAQREEGIDLVYWRTDGHPELMPGLYGAIYVSGVDLPEGAIGRIVAKSWEVSDPTGAARFTQELTLAIVEYPV